MNPSAINLEISLNNGFTYVGMLSGSMPSNDVLWENCPWVIPDMLDNVSLISNQVKIRVSVYGNETVNTVHTVSFQVGLLWETYPDRLADAEKHGNSRHCNPFVNNLLSKYTRNFNYLHILRCKVIKTR